MSENVVDELQLKVSANANTAVRNLTKLSEGLDAVARSTRNANNAAQGMGNFTSMLSRFSSIDSTNLRNITNDLKKLSRVDLSNLKNPINIKINSADINGVNAKIAGLRSAIQDLPDVKSTGVTSLVNSMKRLSEVNLEKFDSDVFGKISDGIKSVADIGDIPEKINRLVASLARLANAGEKSKIVTQNLPPMGAALREVIDGLTSAGGIPGEIVQFASAISSLANAGNKTSVTAAQLKELSKALLEFMESMSNAPMVSQNVVQMTQALAMLATSGGKAGSAAKSVGKSLTNLSSRNLDSRLRALGQAADSLAQIIEKGGRSIKAGAAKMVAGIKQIITAAKGLVNLRSAASNIRDMIAAMIGFRGIVGLVRLTKETIMLGANLTEIDHIVESVFGNMATRVDTWAKDAITSFGIAEHAAKQYAGTLSAMFQSSGIGYKDAGKMAMDLVGLAGDLSAFYNEDTETAYQKIRSGISGMIRPLRAYGIDLSAASLEEFRLEQGITKAYSAMSQAEKVMLRYQYLMAKTTQQQGDFSRTCGRSKRAA